MTITPAPPTTTAPRDTGRAIVQHRYGSDPAAVLEHGQVARREPGTGELLVRVEAASIDRGTWHLMAGRPHLVRLMGFGFRRPGASNPGRAFAGVVDAVGPGVAGFAVGDPVYGATDGALAEWVVADASTVAPVPNTTTMVEAATLPISAASALQAVRDVAGVGAGERVLVLGASGGVGSFAAQIARALGGHVTGTAGTAKLEAVRSLGLDRVVDHRRTDPLAVADDERYDVIIDTGGHRRLRDLRRALTREGRLVIVGSETGGRWMGGFDRQLRAALWSLVVPQRLAMLVSSEDASVLHDLADLVDRGEVRPLLDHVVPFEETIAALDRLIAGEVAGKVAVTLR